MGLPLGLERFELAAEEAEEPWSWADAVYLRIEASSEIRWGVGFLSRRVAWKLLWGSDRVQMFEGGGTAEVSSVMLVRIQGV